MKHVTKNNELTLTAKQLVLNAMIKELIPVNYVNGLCGVYDRALNTVLKRHWRVLINLKHYQKVDGFKELDDEIIKTMKKHNHGYTSTWINYVHHTSEIRARILLLKRVQKKLKSS